MRQKLKIRKQSTTHGRTENIKENRRGTGCFFWKKSCLSLTAFLLAALMLASGCATTGSVQEQKQIATLTAIDITDNTLNINADKPFTYTIYKPSDPYKAIVELPDVRLGIAAGKIKSEKAGITEIVPSQTEEPLLTKLEILLSSPAGIVPAYKGTLLTLNIISLEGELKAKTTEKAAETPKAEETKIAAEKIEDALKEAKTVEITKPEEKPKAAEKEEPALPKTAAPKEIPLVESSLRPATSIVKVTVEKEQDVLKLIIKGNGSLNPNVFELDNRTVLDIPNVTLEALLPKAQAPLKGIRSGKYKNKTRIVLDMKEKTSYAVTSIEDSVIVAFQLPEKEKYAAKAEKKAETAVGGEVKTEAKAQTTETEKPVEGKYKGQKISLDFQDADIGPIFRLLADISGYNFVIDSEVKGKITLKLMNVPWEQALDIILQTHGLAKQEEGNIMWIAPIAKFTKMSKEKTEAKASEEIAEELVQEVIRINYAASGDISGAIDKGKLLSSRGSITPDARMNTLIIKDTQKNINKIKELVKIMDVTKSQVMIEAKLVTVSSDYAEKLGIRWGGTLVGGPGGVFVGDAATGAVTASATPTGPGGIRGLGQDVAGAFSVNTPISSTTGAGGVLSMLIGSANSARVALSLSALESINKARTLSNPKILTMDNEAATIQQGQTFFVQTTSAEGTKTEEKQATLSLAVTPKITPDGYVQLKVTATDNSLTSVNPPVMDTKTLNTNALVKNGETLVLGGIYTTSTTEGEEGIPLLGRIPILGWLFKTRTKSGPNVKELLIFITPTIVTKP